MAYRVITAGLNIREHPSTRARSVGKFLDGELLFPTEEVEADDHIWQKHRRGWSASKTVGGYPFMRPFNPRPGAWLLEVPYVSQLGNEAKKSNDCGQALVAAEIAYLRQKDVTPDTLSAIEPGITDHTELKALARRYGIELQSFWLQSIDLLPLQLEKGMSRPVIMLVDYQHLGFERPDLKNNNRQGWHWIAIVGMDADKSAFYFHDPLWLDTTVNHQGGYGGAFLRIEMAQLKKAALLKNSPVII